MSARIPDDSPVVDRVYAAKQDAAQADAFIAQYLPFVKAETARFLGHPPVEGREDALSIALCAFHEAILHYQRAKGAFFRYAARIIRNRLIDEARRERRHSGQISFEAGGPDDAQASAPAQTLSDGIDPAEALLFRTATRQEIADFDAQLRSFGLCFADIADNTPKQQRTLSACYRALHYAKAHPQLLQVVEQTGRLPMSELVRGADVERKTLERHRKYMVAILLAYTNGYEIIRGHLCQVAPRQAEEDFSCAT